MAAPATDGEAGIDNRVVDYEIHPCISPSGPACGCSKSLPAILSASIEVNRRHRRAKTDALDVRKLVEMLVRSQQEKSRVWQEVRIPSEEEEDKRRLHRE
ncbi:MAG: hypothetical protein ACRERS_01390, partial [Methylococcales bacterium]